MIKLPTGGVPMRNRVALWKTLLVLGGALVVVSGRDQVFGQDGTWIAKAPMPTPRTGLAVGVVNGILYAVGGFREDSKPFTDTMDAYDPVRNMWTAKGPMTAIPRGGGGWRRKGDSVRRGWEHYGSNRSSGRLRSDHEPVDGKISNALAA